MNCPYCNTQVTDGTQKCPFCGQQVSPGNTSGSTSPRCPRCGAGLANGAKFCSTCGASLQQTAYGPTMPPPVPPAPAGQYMFCPHCRSQVPFGVSVCPVCNARLNTTEVFNDSNGTAIAAFVMALLSLPFPVLTIPAIVCGHIGLAHSRRTLGNTGQGMATAALVIGYITVAGWLLILLFVVGGCAALMSMAE